MTKPIENIKICENIDYILSNEGGIPRGKMVEMYGPDGSGKSTLLLIAIRESIKSGLKVAYIDIEHSLVPSRAEDIGVDLKKLKVIHPENGEDAIEQTIKLCEEGYGLIGFDSIAGIITESQEEDSKQFAQVASLMAKNLMKVRHAAIENDTTIIFTNQIRAVFKTFGFGPDTDSFGGYAIKHTVDARFEIRRVSWMKYSDKVVGFRIKIRAPHKNRFAPPNREAFMNISFDRDFKLIGDMENLVELGKAEKNGPYYTYKDKKFKGKEIPNDILTCP